MGGTCYGRYSRLPAQYLRVACPTVVLSRLACLMFRTFSRPSKATNTCGGLRLSMKTKIKQDEGVDEGNTLQELLSARPNHGNKLNMADT